MGHHLPLVAIVAGKDRHPGLGRARPPEAPTASSSSWPTRVTAGRSRRRVAPSSPPASPAGPPSRIDGRPGTSARIRDDLLRPGRKRGRIGGAATRMRPRTLDEVAGRPSLLAPGARRRVSSRATNVMILWARGREDHLARLVAHHTAAPRPCRRRRRASGRGRCWLGHASPEMDEQRTSSSWTRSTASRRKQGRCCGVEDGDRPHRRHRGLSSRSTAR